MLTTSGSERLDSGSTSYCVFATHHCNVTRFYELPGCWDTRDPARNFSKALAFSTIYVGFIRRYLGPSVQIVFVDSSPLDLPRFLRSAFPELCVEEMRAEACFRSSADIVCIRFGDNIGHLSVSGKDGWGRSCMKGLEYCLTADYQYAVHVEADLLVRGEDWVRKFVAASPQAGIIAPRMHLGLETGLFIARTAWLKEVDFIERYNWRKTRNRPRPEERFAAISAGAWVAMDVQGGRGEMLTETSERIRNSDYYWLTHATADQWKAFFKESRWPVPQDLAAGVLLGAKQGLAGAAAIEHMSKQGSRSGQKNVIALACLLLVVSVIVGLLIFRGSTQASRSRTSSGGEIHLF